MPHEFECNEAGCEFHVRANEPDEVIQVVGRHAKDVHDVDMAEDMIRSRMSEV